MCLLFFSEQTAFSSPPVCCPVIVTSTSGTGGAGVADIMKMDDAVTAGTVFVAMQAFSPTPLSLSLLMVLLQWSFGEAAELLRLKGREEE